MTGLLWVGNIWIKLKLEELDRLLLKYNMLNVLVLDRGEKYNECGK